jgi:hypothetical protein
MEGDFRGSSARDCWKIVLEQNESGKGRAKTDSSGLIGLIPSTF